MHKRLYAKQVPLRYCAHIPLTRKGVLYTRDLTGVLASLFASQEAGVTAGMFLEACRKLATGKMVQALGVA